MKGLSRQIELDQVGQDVGEQVQTQDTELFVSHAACALDDAYRACIDGTTCHPDIAELTKDCHPSYLERIVSSLRTAVDGSYSAGMTGVKMALTRALGVVAG